jgi:transglutaminase-like putative cysteine protease
MGVLRALVVTAIMLAGSVCFAGDKSDKSDDKVETWLPVTQQELAVKVVPGNPNADAVQLYFSYFKDDDSNYLFTYRRIKILRDAGKERYGNPEIEIETDNSLKELNARTIHPDGTIIDFKDKVYEKTIIKTRGVKKLVKTFALPDVTVGSIVEYRYTITLPPHVVDSITVWPMQSDLYTLKARFRFKPYHGVVAVPSEFSNLVPHSQVSYAYLNQLDATVPTKKRDNLMVLEAENVVPFEAEEYMPPESDYKPVVIFYYGGHEVASPDKYWQTTGKAWSEWTEKFIGNYGQVREAALQAIGNESDSAKKLQRLYARAQQIRNLSYERDRTQEEAKKEKLKINQNAAEVLGRGFGSAGDINRLFIAMARAAGFEAYVVEASDRTERSFIKELLLDVQFNAPETLVKVDGKELMLSPGTPFCPFGLVPWPNTAVTALKFGKAGAEFMTTPKPQNSQISRVAKTALMPDGTLKGEISLEFNGQDALQYRLSAFETDEAGRRKDLEEHLKAWLPAGALVSLKDSQGWTAMDEPLKATLTVEIPGYATVAGKRLVSPSFLFPTLQKDMFKNDYRKYPVSFSYPFTESDQVTIKLPQGYTMEVAPYRRKSTLSYASYEVSSALDGDQLTTKRQLKFDGLKFDPDQYPQLKGFFNIVQAGDGGQAVLQVQESAAR